VVGAGDAVTDQEWSKVKSLLQEVSDLDVDAREEILRQRARAGQQSIVAEVRELLSAGDGLSDSSFLEPPSLEAFTEAVISIQPGTMYADFEVIEEIGRGGAGVVYRARQESLGRDVALKLLMPRPSEAAQETRRFIREARSAASLQHPGIVSVHAVGVEEGVAYLVMELAGAGTLAETTRDGGVAWQQVLDWVIEVATAMQVAHAAGIVHRDLKPSNLLLATDGRVVIADFGLARGLEGGLETTFVGAIGTPRYMAPESLSEQFVDPLDPRVDVYALGVVLFELLSGRAPFQADTLHELFEQVRGHDPFLERGVLDSVPLELQAICSKAMEKEPHRRYASMLEFCTDLQNFRSGRPIRAKIQPRWLRRLRSYSRVSWAAAALLVTMLAMAALLYGEWSKVAPIGEDETRFLWEGSDDVELVLELARPTSENGLQVYEELARLGGKRVSDLRLPRGLYRATAWRGAQFSEWDIWPQPEVQLATQGLVYSENQRQLGVPMLHIPSGSPEFDSSLVVPAFELDRNLVNQASYALFLAWARSRVSEADYQEVLLPIYWEPEFSLRWCFSPAIGVPPSAAQAYARWRGKRLPTSLELLRAHEFVKADLHAPSLLEAWRARQAGWRADFQYALTSSSGCPEALRGVRELHEFVSSFGGSLGLFSGLREWTSSLNRSVSGDRVWFGAAWHDPPTAFKSSSRGTSPAFLGGSGSGSSDIGFRCARSVHIPQPK